MSTKVKIPMSIKTAVKAKFNCCAACGTWDADNVGHIIAESKGGTLAMENLILLCGNCNQVQSNINIQFAAFAEYAIEPTVIIARRKYWEKYCGAARNGLAVKPYKPL